MVGSLAITRRQALRLAAGSAVFCAFGSGAGAFEFRFGSEGRGQDSGPDDTGRSSQMLFTLAGGARFKAKSLLIVTDSGAYTVAFARKVTRRDEDKIGIVRDAPLVGGLFTDRLRGKNFDPSLRIGPLYGLEETLVADLRRGGGSLQDAAAEIETKGTPPPRPFTLRGQDQPVAALRVANQKISYGVAGPQFTQWRQGLDSPALRALANGKTAESLGGAYRSERQLLLLVNPSILTDYRS